MLPHKTRVIPGYQSHWRWLCTCGAKGMNIIYRDVAQHNGLAHEKRVHGAGL